MVTPRVGKPNGDPTPDRFQASPAESIDMLLQAGWWEIRDTSLGEHIVVVYCRHRYDALLIQDVLETATGRPERLDG